MFRVRWQKWRKTSVIIKRSTNRRHLKTCPRSHCRCGGNSNENRVSATTSRHKQKTRITELEQQIAVYQQKYTAVPLEIQRMEKALVSPMDIQVPILSINIKPSMEIVPTSSLPVSSSESRHYTFPHGIKNRRHVWSRTNSKNSLDASKQHWFKLEGHGNEGKYPVDLVWSKYHSSPWIRYWITAIVVRWSIWYRWENIWMSIQDI